MPGKDENYSIVDVDSLERLVGMSWRRRRRLRVTLDLPFLPEVQRQHFETTLRGAVTDCGCKVGAVLLVGASLIFLIRIVVRWPHIGLADAGIGFIIAFLAAFIGKALGLTLARFRLMRAAQHIKGAIEAAG